ncbi:MAG: TolB family protein, partial [Anaerolineales bacterium]
MNLPKLIPSLFLLLCLVACSIQISDVTPAPAPTSTSPPSTPQAPTQTQTSTPPSWAHLQLTGRLLFTHGRLGIEQLDLATGALTNVFVPPAQGWLTAASVSPDGRQIVVAYAPPPPAGKVQLGYTDLYLMPTDGSAALTPLLQRTEAQESFFNPSWSPDGQYVYYAHFVIPTIGVTPEATPEFQPPRYTIERAPYPAGQPQVLVENAYWPT